MSHTFKYKNAYIHIDDSIQWWLRIGDRDRYKERVKVQFNDNTILKVKSVHAAKIIISRREKP